MTEKESWPARALMRRHAALWSVVGAFWALIIIRLGLTDTGTVAARAVLLAVVSGACFAGSLVCIAALVSRPSRSYRALNRQGRQRVDAALAFGFPDDAQPFRRVERDLALALRAPAPAAVAVYAALVLAAAAWLAVTAPGHPAWFLAAVVVVALLALLGIRAFHPRQHLALRAVLLNTDGEGD